ncbi:GntR family transcriptional regulator, partial [Vibrio sp. 10N.222.55.E8]
FSVSRGPVREALRTLEGQGLLEQRKNCGWFVRSLSSDEIKDIFIFREILDNGLSFLLTKNIEQSKFQDYLSELDGLIDAMDKAIIKEDQVKFAILNQKFHDTLIMLS